LGRGSAPPSTTPTTDGIVAAVIQEGTRRGIDTRWLKDDVVALYQDLHRHPELSGQEHRTQRGVAEALAGTRADLHECAGTGLVAMLRNGPGPVVWLHFDTDALPLTEQTGLPYAGTERATLPDGQVVGVMHACGHDVHTAALVGCLRQLDRDRAGWRGTVVGVFQPAEETGRGALAMLDELVAGALSAQVPRPDAVYAQHVTSAPLGRVVCRPRFAPHPEHAVVLGIVAATCAARSRLAA
jgi:Metal-dependent amidase/aminoacylase/carboxypeptidase